MGTHVLIETAKNFGIKRFIHVSTDEVSAADRSEPPGRLLRFRHTALAAPHEALRRLAA